MPLLPGAGRPWSRSLSQAASQVVGCAGAAALTATFSTPLGLEAGKGKSPSSVPARARRLVHSDALAAHASSDLPARWVPLAAVQVQARQAKKQRREPRASLPLPKPAQLPHQRQVSAPTTCLAQLKHGTCGLKRRVAQAARSSRAPACPSWPRSRGAWPAAAQPLRVPSEHANKRLTL